MKQLWNFFITKWFPSPPIRRGWKSIYEPLWTLLDQFYLINLSIECKYSHKSSYLLCSFLEYGGGCITPMEFTLAIGWPVLNSGLFTGTLFSRSSPARISLRIHPIPKPTTLWFPHFGGTIPSMLKSLPICSVWLPASC